MKKLCYLFIVLSMVLFFAGCGSENTVEISSDTSIGTGSAKISAESIISKMQNAKYKDGELLVKFKSGIKASSSLRTHQAIGASLKKKYSIIPNLELVVLPEGLSVKDAIVTYMSDPNVEYVEPNYIRSALETIPNDQLFGDQWALRNTGQYAAGTDGADIKATLAWDISQGSHNTIIAVLDTGIDYNHVDLIENIWRNWGETSCVDSLDNDNNGYIDDCIGWDFTTCEEFDDTGTCITTKTEDNDPMDGYGHGTHVAGIIGAETNNGIGIAGVMWNVQLMPVKMLNDQGYGTLSDEIAAIDYVVAMKQSGVDIKAMNASFGGYEYSDLEKQAIESANSEGILFVAAAGNDGTNNDHTPMYPASYSLSNIISVTATDQNDRRASFSNFGQYTVHVGAPGVYILSTIPENQYTAANQDFEMGTSMATPHVTGLVGLLWNYYYYFNYSQIRGTILRYVDIVSELQGWIYTGGRINAYGSLSSLLTPEDLSLNVDSSSQITLTWNDRATGEDYYRVERSTSGGAFEHITTLGTNSSTYTDSSLIDGTSYSYRVRAESSLPNPPTFATNNAYSLYSNEATAVTPLNPPTGLSATTQSSSEISLSWTDNSNTEEGYRIERSSSNFVQIAEVGPNVTAYSDTGLNPSTRYTYRVGAFNTAAGGSQYSNEASATTLTSTGAQPSSGGGGGSCSIGSIQNTPTAIADLAVMLIPLLYIVILRRRR